MQPYVKSGPPRSRDKFLAARSLIPGVRVLTDNATLITVIIPAFNAAQTITDTLDSVSSQTHRHIEVLVVDDGSSDDTVEVVTQHIQRDPRIRLLRQPNAGVSAARNKALHEA